MPFNGSGVFQRVRNWVADATAGIKIRADYHDAEDDGFAAGLTNCITKDGQTIVTQNIPWNSKRITGLADPINAQDAATMAYADTKLSGVGGTITGNLTINGDLAVNGKVAAYGYQTRAGLPGPFGGSWFNFNWTGNLEAWVDNTNIGALATQAFANTAASNSAAGKVNRSGDTMGGNLTTAVSGDIGQAGAVPSLQVMGSSTNSGIAFHCPGSFGANFGMRNDGNFYMGGWSHGGSVFKFWTTRDFGSLPTGTISNVRWLHAGASYPPGAQAGVWQDPFPSSVIYLYASTGGGGGIQGFQHKYFQAYTTSWFTIGF